MTKVEWDYMQERFDALKNLVDQISFVLVDLRKAVRDLQSDISYTEDKEAKNERKRGIGESDN